MTPSKETLKELLMKETPVATPIETILVPANTTVPAVAVSGEPMRTDFQLSLGSHTRRLMMCG